MLDENKKYSKISDINSEVFNFLSNKYGVNIQFVEDCWDSCLNWLEANGKKKKNYKAFLANWVKTQKNSKKFTPTEKGRVLDVSKL